MRSSETRGIRKRGEVWWVDVMVAGERVRRPAGRTLKRALAVRDRLLAEKTAARDRGPDTLFDTLAVRYLAKLRLTAKPTSLQTAESAVRRLIAHFGGGVVSALGANDLRQYQGARLTTSGPEAANKDTRYLREILRLGVEEEVISRLPFRVSLLRTPKKLPTVLTAEEVRRLLDAAEGPLRVILTLAAYTGLRAG